MNIIVELINNNPAAFMALTGFTLLIITIFIMLKKYS